MFLLPDEKATSWTACAKAHSQKEITGLFEKYIFLLQFSYSISVFCFKIVNSVQ